MTRLEELAYHRWLCGMFCKRRNLADKAGPRTGLSWLAAIACLMLAPGSSAQAEPITEMTGIIGAAAKTPRVDQAADRPLGSGPNSASPAALVAAPRTTEK